MAKAVLSIFLFCFYTMSAGIVFSEQIAVTPDGREVILNDDRTWNYFNEEMKGMNIVEANERLKGHLVEQIEDRSEVFADRFGIPVDWNLPFEEKYKRIIEHFYALSRGMPEEEFFKNLADCFGPIVAEDAMLIFGQWDLWEKL